MDEPAVSVKPFMRSLFRIIYESPRRLYELLTLPRAVRNLAGQNDRLNQKIDETSRHIADAYHRLSGQLDETNRIVEAHIKEASRLAAEHAGQMRVAVAEHAGQMRAAVAEQINEARRVSAAVSEQVDQARRMSAENIAQLAAMQRELREELSTELSFGVHDLGQLTQGKYGELKGEIANLLARMHAAVEAALGATGNKQNETVNLIAHLNTSLQSRMNELGNSQFEIRNTINHLQTSSDARLTAFENASFETKNAIDHLNTSLHSRLNKIENAEIPALGQEIHELMALQFQGLAKASNQAPRKPLPGERYGRAEPRPFNSYLASMKEAFPRAYPLWKARLEATRKAFSETKAGNAAHAGDVYSRIFRSFVEVHACGRTLDVGCGVFGRPYYLDSYPPDLLSGIDPLKPTVSPDFEFVQGISEELPWPNDSFSTVISATSLDHCMSLERSLAEINRVLTPGGRFLLWIGSIPGATRFDPEDPDAVPADRFHLFHLDSAWLEPILVRGFEIVDRMEFRKPGYSHVIYCWVKRS